MTVIIEWRMGRYRNVLKLTFQGDREIPAEMHQRASRSDADIALVCTPHYIIVAAVW
ncbi:MAG: hypothetical protein R2854_02735 [Caldilineaceae bacterium]